MCPKRDRMAFGSLKCWEIPCYNSFSGTDLLDSVFGGKNPTFNIRVKINTTITRDTMLLTIVITGGKWKTLSTK